MGRVVIQDGRSKVGRPEFCTDCELDRTRALCHLGDADFARGYDQAAAEIMSEVRARDPVLYRDMVTKYPSWKQD